MTPLLLAVVLSLDAPLLPSADTTQARWLADLDPARVAEVVVPGPLPAAGRLQSFSLPVSSSSTLWRSGAEV